MMCVGVALHGAAANVGADGDRAAFERHKAEVQRARNSCKFTGSLKDTAQAERVLQLLNHTGAVLTANAACTRLLRSLDPEPAARHGEVGTARSNRCFDAALLSSRSREIS